MSDFSLRILRRAQVHDRVGLKDSALQARINRGTFPPPIPLGPKVVGWIESEVDAVVKALIRGRDEAALKLLVADLLAQRAKLTEAA